LHDEHFHLPLKIERAAELQRFYFGRARALTKIGEIRSAHCQSSAGHDATQFSRKSIAAAQARDRQGAALRARKRSVLPVRSTQ
jgi:hypothetical protein